MVASVRVFDHSRHELNLKMLRGVAQPNDGRVLQEGRRGSGEHPPLRHVPRPQGAQAHPRLTCLVLALAFIVQSLRDWNC